MRTATLLSAIAFLGSALAVQNTYIYDDWVGCYPPSAIPAGTVIPQSELQTSPGAPDLDCGNACRALNGVWSYFMYIKNTESCTCLSAPPPAWSDQIPGDWQGYCDNYDNADLLIIAPKRVPLDRWQMAMCWTGYDPAIQPNSYVDLTSAGATTAIECLKAGAAQLTYLFGYNIVWDPLTTPSCWMFQGSASGTPVVPCQATGNAMTFQYLPAPSPNASGAARRRARQRRERETFGSNRLCPVGQDACYVGSDRNAGYECLDTGAELESCGGCLYGKVGANETSSGVDCTALEGVTLGGVTCMSGQCAFYT